MPTGFDRSLTDGPPDGPLFPDVVTGTVTSASGVAVLVTQVALEAVISEAGVTAGSGSPSIAGIVQDLCERAGLLPSEIDVSFLTAANLQPNNECLGYVIERPTPAADALRVLMQAYFFDACESGGVVRFVPRGLPAAATIPESRLGLVEDKHKLTETMSQEQDLPQTVVVLHNDPAQNYQQNKQHKGRNVRIVKTKNQTIISLPIVMTEAQALAVAKTWLYYYWLEREQFSFNDWCAVSMLIDPCDVIEVVYEGLTFQIRITETTGGVGFTVSIAGVSENESNFLTGGSPPIGFPRQAGGGAPVSSPGITL